MTSAVAQASEALVFMNATLPTEGHRCIATGDTHPQHHRFFQDNADAAQFAAEEDARGRQLWFGAATYRSPAAGRRGTNVLSARALWLDIDCGSGKAHPDRLAGLTRLRAFITNTGLTAPLIVSSGHGVHVWWTFTAPVEPAVRSRLATVLKQACDREDLGVDHARTTDIASLMRLPGTHNRKDPVNPQPVKVLRWARATPADEIEAGLARYMGAIRPRSVEEINADLSAGLDFGRAWFDRLAPDQQIECVREMLNAVRYLAAGSHEEWLRIIASVARGLGEQGRELAQKWSQTCPTKYNQQDFERSYSSFLKGARA